MPGITWTPRVSSRTASPCSNICCFQADLAPGVNYVAFATSDGCIIVQQAVHAPADARGEPPILLMQHSDGSAADSSPPAQGQYITTAILDPPEDSKTVRDSNDGYQWVAWGGGPGYLLCAASDTRLDFFCLRQFFLNDAVAFTHAANAAAAAQQQNPHLRLLTTTAGTTEPRVPIPLVLWPRVATHRLTHGLLGLDWTQDTTGVLLSDEEHNVTMLNVDVKGVDSVHVAKGGMPEVDISVAWTARSDTAQPLAAAGWAPGSPSATANTKLTTGGASAQHRVLIWWPRPIQEHKAPAAAAPAPAPAPTKLQAAAKAAAAAARGGAKPAAAAAAPAAPAAPAKPPPKPTGPQRYTVGNEVIRHPCKVLAMQWSPPLWQGSMSRSNSSNDLTHMAHTGHGTRSNPGYTPTSAYRAASLSTATQQPQQPQQPAVDHHLHEAGDNVQLALMTVGADWVVRIWVEVKMKDLLPAHLTAAAADPVAAAAAAAALSMSQFCLALVIDPPVPPPPPPPPGAAGAAVAGGALAGTCAGGGLRAAWARPMARAFRASEGGQGHATYGASHEAGGSGGGCLPHGMSRDAVKIASRVQWLVACIGQPAPASPHQMGSTQGAGEIEETLYVWALDGLQADAVIAQQQQQQYRGGMAAGRAGSGPRAVLWGRETRHMQWLQSQHMAHRKDIRLHTSAYVLYPKGSPVFHSLEWWRSPEGRVAEARAVVIDAVTQDVGHTACPHTGITFESVSNGLFNSVTSQIRSLTPHPSVANLAASLFKDGRVGFWWLDPLEELPLTSRRPTHSRHRYNRYLPPSCSEALLDPCAMTGMFGPVSAVAWLTLRPPHAPQHAAPPAPPAPASAFASERAQASLSPIRPRIDVSGGGFGPVLDQAHMSHLACAVAGTVYVYALHVPDYTELTAGATPAPAWGVMVVSEVLRLQLPQPLLHVTQLFQSGSQRLSALGTEPPSDLMHANQQRSQRSLLGDYNDDSNVDGGSEVTDNGGSHLASLGASAWVTWELLTVGPTNPPNPRQQPPTQQMPQIHASEPVVLATTDLAQLRPADSVETGRNSQGQANSKAVITCVDLGSHWGADTGAEKQGGGVLCVTGNSMGLVQFWQLESAGGAAPRLQATCWCDVPLSADGAVTGAPYDAGLPYTTASTAVTAASPRSPAAAGSAARGASGAAATTSAATAVVTVASSPDSAATGGAAGSAFHCLPVGLALHAGIGAAAAVATCGPAGAEDVLFVWRSATVTKLVTTEGAAHKSCELTDRWELEDVVVLRETAYCVCWIPAPANSLVALLAVGYASGEVEYFAPGRTGGWRVVARYRVHDDSDGISALLGLPGGACVTAAGAQLHVLSAQLWSPGVPSSGPASQRNPSLAVPPANNRLNSIMSSVTSNGSSMSFAKGPGATLAQAPLTCSLGELLQQCGAPLPWYHPLTLTSLIRCGQAALVGRLLRHLIMWLTHAAAVLRNHEEQRRLHELAVAAAPAAAASHAQHSAQAASGPVQEPVLPPLPPPPLDALLAELRVTGSNGGGAAGSAASAALVQTLQQLQLLPPNTAAAAQPGSVPSASRSASTATATAGTVLTTQPTFSNASTLSQSTIPSRTAPQPGAAPSHDSGMLDMSAFGGFGAFDSFSGSKSEQAETQMPSMSQGLGGQPSISAGSVTLRKGMGESIHNSMAQPATGSTAPAAASAQDSSMLTGMLDMSAFGIDMGPPSPPQEPAAQPPPAAAVGGSSMMSGMIDMSAFGMAGFDFPSGQMEPPAQPPTPPPITPPPASAVHDPDLPLAALKALRKQEQQATATASTQGPPQSQDSTIATSATNGTTTSPTPTPSPFGTDLVLYPRAPVSASGPNNSLSNKSIIAPARPVAGVSGPGCVLKAGVGLGGGVDSAPASAALQEALLSKDEIVTMQSLLYIDLTSVAKGSQSVIGADKDAFVQPALPSYLQEDDGSASVFSRAEALRSALSLTPTQTTQLLLLARSLSHTTPSDLTLAAATSPQGLGAVFGSAPLQPDADTLAGRNTTQTSSHTESIQDIWRPADTAADNTARDSTRKNAGDILEGLDSPAQAFILAARLAAAWDAASASLPTPEDMDWDGQGDGEGTLGAAVGNGPSEATSRAIGGSQSRLDAASGPSGFTPSPSYKQLYKRGASQAPDGPNSSRTGPAASGTTLNTRLRSFAAAGTSPHTRRPSGLSSAASKPSQSLLLSFSSAGALIVPSSATAAAQAPAGARGAWWRRLGLLRQLDMRVVMQAAASGSQGALLSAALPHVAWRSDMDVLAAPDQQGGGRAGFASSAARSGRPDIAWPLMRKLGAGLWLLDSTALTAKAEELARSQYARHKDPYECALLYLALGKKAMLLNLFKQASNMKLVEFLSRDFNQSEQARLAAAKNAYALLGQHKYDLAAAFFLLAKNVREAVGVLAHERGDPQLALMVARIAEGGAGGPAGSLVIHNDLIPVARQCPDPAALPCLLWADNRPADAIQTLALAYGPLPGLPGSVTAATDSVFARRCNDPGLLHVTLSLAGQQLAGKPVSRHLAAGLASLALRCASRSESLGVPTLTLPALLAAITLLTHTHTQHTDTDPTPPHLTQTLLNTYARAAAAALLQLEPTHTTVQCSPHDQDATTSQLAAPGQSTLAVTGLALPGVALGSMGCVAHGGGHVGVGVGVSRDEVVRALGVVYEFVHSQVPTAAADALCPDVGVVIARIASQLAVQQTDAGATLGLLAPATQRCSATGQPLTPTDAAGRAATVAAHSADASHGTGPSPRMPPPITTFGSGGGAKASHSNVHTPHSQATVNTPTSRAGSVLSLPTAPTPGPHLRHGSASQGSIHPSASRVSLDMKSETGGRAPQGGILADPWEVLSVDGDKAMSLACCSARGAATLGRKPTDSRPIIAAMSKAGLVSADVELPISAQAALASDPTQGGAGGADRPNPGLWARQGSMFMGLLGQVLEHVRWTPDPWAAVTQQSAQGQHPTHPTQPGQGPAGGAGGGNAGSLRQQTLSRVSHSVSLTAQTSTTHAVCVAAHPYKEVYVSGSSGDHVFLWSFKEHESIQAYVPLIEPNTAAAHAARGAAGGGGRGGGGGAAGGHGFGLEEGSAALALAHAAPSRKHLLLQLLQSPHWDGAACLRYTPDGHRFAGVGVSGLVALWRQDLAPGIGGVGYADWVHHCVGKKGTDLLFTDEGGRQIIVCGRGDKGGVVTWWDTQAPPASCCIAELKGRKATPTCMQLMRSSAGGHTLVMGDDAGEVCGLDLRMLGSQVPLWVLPKPPGPHGGACTCMASWSPDTDPFGLSLPRPPPSLATLPAALTRRGSSTDPSPAPSRTPSHPGALAGAASGGTAAGTTVDFAAAPPLRLRDLVAVGGKEGSVLFIDATSGHCVQALDRVHWQVKRNPLTGLLHGGEHRSSPYLHRYGTPANASGVAVNGIVCVEGGMLTCGMDGIVRFHPLQVVANRAEDAA